MTTIYERAVAAIERQFGSGSAEALVVRCEADDAGALTLTLATPEGPRWFAVRADVVTELTLDADARVIVAERLAGMQRTGSATILSWRPGRRIVARLDGGSILKGFRRGRSKRAAAHHERVAAALDGNGFRIARVLAHDPASEFVVYEHLAGRPFSLGSTDSADSALVAIGSALARFQKSEIGADVAVHTRHDELVVLDTAAERWQRVAGSLPGGWQHARTRLAAIAEGAGGTCLAHRDLHDGQILLDGGAPALLDLDLTCRAERELDLSNLAIHLDLAALQGVDGATQTRARAGRDALNQAYSSTGAPPERSALGFYAASTALRLALLYGLRPRWRGLAPALVDLAERSLSEPTHA